MFDLKVLKNLKILLVEDDETILKELEKTLQIFVNEVFIAKNGKDAYSIYKLEKPDIVLTDIKMPILNGVELTKKIRESDYTTPIILMSAYSEQETLLKALNLGVDGYIIKPVELEELISGCVNSVKRKHSKSSDLIITFKNGLIFNNSTKELTYDGNCVELGIKEFGLLEMFINHREKAITKENIVSTLWPCDEITDSALKCVLSRLRKKIGEEHIVNIKGYGWKFTLEP